MCDKSSIKEKAKLDEFYLHNLTLTDINVWDPNEKLGDLQLMALASWMSHEEAKVEEVKRVLVKEEKLPVYIRAKQISSKAVISNQNIISNDVKLAPRYLSTQE